MLHNVKCMLHMEKLKRFIPLAQHPGQLAFLDYNLAVLAALPARSMTGLAQRPCATGSYRFRNHTSVEFDPANLRKLHSAFEEIGGSVTAGNSSSIIDGAAALMLVSGEKALEAGLKVIVKVAGYANAEQVVAFANQELVNLNLAKVNVHGGGVPLGHPLGCSGACIIMTLLGVSLSKYYYRNHISNGEGVCSYVARELVRERETGTGTGTGNGKTQKNQETGTARVRK